MNWVGVATDHFKTNLGGSDTILPDLRCTRNVSGSGVGYGQGRISTLEPPFRPSPVAANWRTDHLADRRRWWSDKPKALKTLLLFPVFSLILDLWFVVDGDVLWFIVDVVSLFCFSIVRWLCVWFTVHLVVAVCGFCYWLMGFPWLGGVFIPHRWWLISGELGVEPGYFGVVPDLVTTCVLFGVVERACSDFVACLTVPFPVTLEIAPGRWIGSDPTVQIWLHK
ncbi:hypothetical protein F3Y22_tig00008957pilonHSYRG00074 [Hibiscus syriacus]|uniref:Uncharacterized protein n=1 Tax=Hibiscus syriacus TaxID=106335 RepID=A0A6A3C7T9_HIBSY|nr:hypothetical protein F3Y22_tig00008957pilonHSYRG00074 [Hibiscus syriacus]